MQALAVILLTILLLGGCLGLTPDKDAASTTGGAAPAVDAASGLVVLAKDTTYRLLAPGAIQFAWPRGSGPGEIHFSHEVFAPHGSWDLQAIADAKTNGLWPYARNSTTVGLITSTRSAPATVTMTGHPDYTRLLQLLPFTPGDDPGLFLPPGPSAMLGDDSSLLVLTSETSWSIQTGNGTNTIDVLPEPSRLWVDAMPWDGGVQPVTQTSANATYRHGLRFDSDRPALGIWDAHSHADGACAHLYESHTANMRASGTSERGFVYQSQGSWGSQSECIAPMQGPQAGYDIVGGLSSSLVGGPREFAVQVDVTASWRIVGWDMVVLVFEAPGCWTIACPGA